MASLSELLTGKICFVTGASRGIGLATVEQMLQSGATVVAGLRDPGIENTALATLLGQYKHLHLVACDVTKTDSIKQAFQTIFKEHKRLDALVANAGVLEDAVIGMVTTEQITRVFEANTFGVIHCAQYAARLMARHNSGSIINMASIIGSNGNTGQTVYAASKAAVIGLTKSLAKELAPQSIRANAIAPGFIATDMARSIPPAKFEERVRSIKMGRVGTPQDVANVAVFLASDLSAYVTGQVIGVDGGMLI